jgi:hypothetical protein
MRRTELKEELGKFFDKKNSMKGRTEEMLGWEGLNKQKN